MKSEINTEISQHLFLKINGHCMLDELNSPFTVGFKILSFRIWIDFTFSWSWSRLIHHAVNVGIRNFLTSWCFQRPRCSMTQTAYQVSWPTSVTPPKPLDYTHLSSTSSQLKTRETRTILKLLWECLLMHGLRQQPFSDYIFGIIPRSHTHWKIA